MYLEPLSDLSWAYRLHYDLAFQTHWRRPHFADQPAAEHLTTLLSEICSHHGYHNLEVKAYPDHARLLISLRPTEVLQPEHHGYARRVLPPVHRFRADERNPLKTAHASFELSHHIVFSTEYRNGVFTSEAGAALARYWLRVAEKHGFAIDQMSFLPDHVHLLVRTHPKSSIESICLSLLNNAQYLMSKHFPKLLIEAGVERLWQASAYAGTCGEMTTALVKWYLNQGS